MLTALSATIGCYCPHGNESFPPQRLQLQLANETGAMTFLRNHRGRLNCKLAAPLQHAARRFQRTISALTDSIPSAFLNAAPRTSAASATSGIVRASTMPPTLSAASARAVVRRS